MGLSLNGFKGILIAIVFLAGFLPSLSPILFRSKKSSTHSVGWRRAFFFGLTNCFAAGVFLSVGLVHLLPDGNEVLHAAAPRLSFPLGSVISGCAFLATFVLEHVVATKLMAKFTTVEYEEKPSEKQKLLSQQDPITTVTERRTGSIKNIRISSKTLQEMILEHQRQRGLDEQDFLSRPGESLEAIMREEENADRLEREYGSFQAKSSNSREHSIRTSSKRNSSKGKSVNSEHVPTTAEKQANANNVVVGVTLFVVLSIHSFFEGSAIGVQKDMVDTVGVFFAIIVHKSIAAFALGTALVKANLSVRTFVIFTFLFSLSSPGGIGVGMIVASMGGSVEVVSGVLVSFASGSFIYIASIELSEEFEDDEHTIPKLACVLVGFSIMCVMSAFYG